MVVSTQAEKAKKEPCEVIELEEVAVRFCGDSGDGMQLAGTQMTNTSAAFGNDISTFPDFPAEIRAPLGTLAGVSGFQLNFGSKKLRTPGDRVNALIAMNPAALRANIADLEIGGILIVNEDAFTKGNLTKAGYDENPLDTDVLSRYSVHRIPIDKLNAEACAETGLSGRAAGRCKNFFALGLTYWLYGRPIEPTLRWIGKKFGAKQSIADANSKSLKAGYYFGETAEMFPARYVVAPAKIEPGRYRKISGNEATAFGLVTAANLAGKPLFYGSYPITPASDILHELAKYKNYDVRVFQAEDEIAAMTSVIGAAFTGALAVTGTSGPGVALKSEALGLAIITELPMVIINVQRGGPSTGLPTKTEQSDLFQVFYGRNGECPIPVIAASCPADCFDVAQEAWRIATRFMTPVIILSDGYIANGSEPWRIPDVADLKPIPVEFAKPPENGDPFLPYARDERLARPWAIPGTPGLEHRIGGLEKDALTGNVSYDADNHQYMCELRARKIAQIAQDVPPQTVDGPESGKLLVLSWGGTYGACSTAASQVRQAGADVAHAHLRYLYPFPQNLGELLE
ncbi:MAG: 2-oxoacid:acceptor oxidoreductase subunit alpha, partial [Planctomycetes bacterium]|nr:2-oxoacid:acceptor oxidoreductase subunit alpha [Planctomycetota bacterium]